MEISILVDFGTLAMLVLRSPVRGSGRPEKWGKRQGADGNGGHGGPCTAHV